MTTFDFTIPVRLHDLQQKQSATDYVVSEIYPVRLLPNKLQGK